jgi:hypothetical protein
MDWLLLTGVFALAHALLRLLAGVMRRGRNGHPPRPMVIRRGR